MVTQEDSDHMDQEKDGTNQEILELSADIVAAYVSHNAVPASELPSLISDVVGAISSTQNQPEAEKEAPKPAVSIRKSITPDYLICLEDGKKFKSLKRHLRTHYDLSPEEYREKWGLPADYPMVAPSYAAARSELAKKMVGLCRREREVRKVAQISPEIGKAELYLQSRVMVTEQSRNAVSKAKWSYAKRRKFAYLHKVSGGASNFVPICNLSGGKAP